MLLDNINSPRDLKKIPEKKLKILCEEIRNTIISATSKNGGHLASSLGVVEMTVALHKVFNLPNDKIVWDVGHQCYAHKILTGRKNKITNIRKEKGISGFPKRAESEYDAFNVGHSSTSISAAYGLANAKFISGESGHVIAVIGDGALSGGLAYEGLNNAGRFHKNFIVVLNDNKMSISKNVGSMSKYLTGIRMEPSYIKVKNRVEWTLNHIPFAGKRIRNVLLKSKSTIRNIIYKRTLFEDMGFVYYGPIDGHDINSLIRAFSLAKKLDKPVLIHAITTKGKGYEFAEKDPKKFHGMSGFDVNTGEIAVSKNSFSDVFGKKLCELAKMNPRICAITAAMKNGTGLYEFSKLYKERFFDVGIAEEHAITFASGLAAGGMRPVFAVYSSFMQRGYDQIVHDAALQNLNVILAIDRAGVVGEDGETHQGLFDVSFLNSIPNVTIFAPSFFNELEYMLDISINKYAGVKAIRYPRGCEPIKPKDFVFSKKSFDLYGKEKNDNLIVTYGRLFSDACIAKENLKVKNIEISILKLNIIKPFPLETLDIACKFKNIFFFEEGMLEGGIGENFGYELSKKKSKNNYEIIAVKDKFVTQSSVRSALNSLGLDHIGMEKLIESRYK